MVNVTLRRRRLSKPLEASMNVNKELEKYKFLRLYDMDFEMALQTISMLKRYKKFDVRFALLRDIVVTYARPFTVSKGFEINNHIYGIKFESNEMKSLHNELLTLRNQLFAHTDLSYKNPKVGKWTLEHHIVYPMSFKSLDYNGLNTKINNIKELIEYVRNQLKHKLKDHEKSF